MKKILLSLSLSAVLILFFTHPAVLSRGCTDGLGLWYTSVLPSLLPFLIFSGLLTKSGLFHLLNRFYAPVIHRIFHISEAGCYAVIVGFLCGFPMGAKVTADLVSDGQISLEEGNYLLGFCNNVSPSFFLNYLCIQNLGREDLAWKLALFFYALPVLYGLFTRRFYHFSLSECTAKKQASRHRIDFPMLDACIMDGFSTVTRLGGYIILFSILIAYLQLLPLPDGLTLFLGAALEISNGIHQISASHLIPDLLRIPCLLMCASFGGLCILAQTSSVLEESGLSIRVWLRGRITLVLLAALPALPLLLRPL